MPGEYETMARAFAGSPQGLKLIAVLDRLNAVTESRSGRELLAMLGGSGGEALRRAAAEAANAARDPARTLLSSLLSSGEGAALVAKIIETAGV